MEDWCEFLLLYDCFTTVLRLFCDRISTDSGLLLDVQVAPSRHHHGVDSEQRAGPGRTGAVGHLPLRAAWSARQQHWHGEGAGGVSEQQGGEDQGGGRRR